MKKAGSVFKKALAAVVAISILMSLSLVGPLNVTAASSGKTYYVAANGSDNTYFGYYGTSENKPLSLKGINTVKLNGGDTVLLKRGDTFLGRFEPEVNLDTVSETSRVTVDAYGEGELPIISLEKRVSKAWEDCGNGFYKIDLSDPANYTGVDNEFTKGNDGDYYCANVNFIEAEDGTIYGELKPNAESCTKKYQFYCDETCVYLKTDVEPYSDLGTCVLPVYSPFKPLFRARRGMIIRNIHFTYGGYGVCSGSNDQTQYVTIENCVFDKIGGANIDPDEGEFTRGGNGIELGSYGSDIIVRNNIFRDVYDVAFSPQGRGTLESPSRWENVTVTNNIFAFNTQAFETWAGYAMKPKAEWTDDNGNGTIDYEEKYYTTDDMVNPELDFGIRNLQFTNNLCIGQSEGWTLFRGIDEPNHHSCVDILSYDYVRPTWSMVETGNTYFHLSDIPAIYGLCITSDDKYLAKDENYNIVTDQNYIYVKNADSTVFRTHNNKPMADFAGWQELGMDVNSTMYTTGGKEAKYAGMYEVAAKSYDFNEIAAAAKAAGVKFNLVYDENATSSKALENNLTANNATVSAEVYALNKCRVTVEVDIPEGKVLKAGGLTYTYGGKTYPITSRVGAADDYGKFDADNEAQVNKYEFIINSNATDVTVNAEFADKGGKNLGVIGASVNASAYKMRFRSRVDRTYENLGRNYQIVSCGTLIFKAEQTDLAAAHLGVQVGTTEGRVVPATQLYDRTDNYYEYVCFVDFGSADSEHLGDDYYVYTYATYKTKDGRTVTLYSDDAAVYSYNGVAAAIS